MNTDETGLRVVIALDIPSEMFARLPKEYNGEKIHYERTKISL